MEILGMTLIELLILIVIAAVCGAIGQALAGYSLGGLLVTIVVGFIGALLGVWLANLIGLPELFVISVGGEPFPIIWSIIGSALLALLFGLASRRRYYPPAY
jgi:uncharacterized membrane protein YeaQ/YmgE (transglycosylase-associated protein family)